MVLSVIVTVAFTALLLLFMAHRFTRLYDIEERHRQGLPTDDLLRPTFLWKAVAWAFATLIASVGLGSLAFLALGHRPGEPPAILFVVSGGIWVVLLTLGWLANRHGGR